MPEPKILRILLFAPAFAPYTSSEAIVNNKLVLAFINEGWEVDVISRHMNEGMIYDYGSSWESLWLPLRNITHTIDYPVGRKIQRIFDIAWSSLRLKHPIAGCRWARRAYEMGIELHSQKRYDLIMSRSLPDAAHLPALVLAQRAGLPWIANWNDPSTGIELPLAEPTSVLCNMDYFHRRFLKAIASKTNWLTFPTDRMKDYICTYLGPGVETKGSAIPHVAIQLPPEGNINRNAFFTMTHAGNLCSERNPENILKGIRKFLNGKGMKAKFQFLIIGRENQLISKLAGQLKLESHVSFLGPLSYMETLQYLLRSDALLVAEASYEKSIFLPSKFVDYAQTGRPVMAVSPRDSVLHDILSVYGGGIAVNCLSDEEISQGIGKLYTSWEGGSLQNEYDSSRLQHLFLPKTVIGQYRAIFHKIGIDC